MTAENDPGKFYDALNAANFEYAALSTAGVNLFGDSKSIDAARRWSHDAAQLPWAKSEMARLQSALARAVNDATALRAALSGIVKFCDDPNEEELSFTLAMGLARLLPAARTALQMTRG